MGGYMRDLWKLVRKPSFTLPLLAAAVLSYLYGATHVAIGIDDLAYEYYLNAGNYIVVGRLFGWVVLYLLRCLGWSIQGAEWVSMALMALSAAAWCVLLQRASSNRLRPFTYPCFACLFVSYPLIHEIWQFSGMNVMISFNYLWSALALTLALSFLDGRRCWWKLACAGLLMTVALSQYESAAVVFVTGSFGLLLMRMLYGAERSRPGAAMVRDGLWLMLALAMAVVFEQLLTRGVLALIGRQPQVFSSRQTAWSIGSMGSTARVLLQRIVLELGILGLWYLPIGVLDLCAAACVGMGIYLAVKGTPAALLPIGGLLLSLILLPLMQGVFIGYRTCQQFGLFTAFTLCLGANLLAGDGRAIQGGASHRRGAGEKREGVPAPEGAVGAGSAVRAGFPGRMPSRRLTALCTALLMGLALWQSAAMTKRSMLDWERYRQEAGDVETMGETLREGFDLSKPVVFFGQYLIDGDILDRCTVDTGNRLYKFFYNRLPWMPQSKRLSDMDLESVIDWSAVALEQGGLFLVKLFHYLGYEEVRAGDLELYRRAVEENGDMPVWPAEGSVRQREDYIVIRIGPEEETP